MTLILRTDDHIEKPYDDQIRQGEGGQANDPKKPSWAGFLVWLFYLL
jgi:hypothetical protein